MRTANTVKARKLFQAAKKARAHAHAPYSKKRIGAAILTADGRVFAGCNVENASYGGTVCAERVATFKAVSEGARMPIMEVCVMSAEKNPWPPCGFCRQVLAEFAAAGTRVHLANARGIVRTTTLGELFPEAFGPAHLRK